jgi:phosphoglycolate phosphatase-like HAD superfamily hydrolase
MNLLLFDIDGTLLLSGGAGTRAMDRGFHYLYGIQEAARGHDFSGMTDPVILKDLFFHFHREACTPEEMNTMIEAYLRFLEHELEASSGFHILPGVVELLDQLSLREDVRLGLATGNLEKGARMKLERAGLLSYFCFGAYGSDTEERPRIVSLAIERGKRLPGSSKGNHVAFVIGDTPLDIQAGKGAGALTVAVATGTKSLEELRRHGPTHLFPDFRQPEDFLRILA